MSYSAAIDGLQALAGELVNTPGVPRRKFRLEEMRTLLAELGDPHVRFPSVLIGRHEWQGFNLGDAGQHPCGGGLQGWVVHFAASGAGE